MTVCVRVRVCERVVRGCPVARGHRHPHLHGHPELVGHFVHQGDEHDEHGLVAWRPPVHDVGLTQPQAVADAGLDKVDDGLGCGLLGAPGPGAGHPLPRAAQVPVPAQLACHKEVPRHLPQRVFVRVTVRGVGRLRWVLGQGDHAPCSRGGGGGQARHGALRAAGRGAGWYLHTGRGVRPRGDSRWGCTFH